jgi:4-hydroxy-4-methyl-2-oxoglutarate aldolase
MQPNQDEALFAVMKNELFSAALGDVLDQLGARHQFLPSSIRPLRPEMVLAGRAMPVMLASGTPPASGAGDARFGKMLDALDALRPGEVYLVDGGGAPYALWGELMGARAGKLGAAGVVLNGFHRDTSGILALDLPTFSHGGYAQDVSGRGYVADFRVPIRIGEVQIAPGDVVFGDVDGVLIVPAGMLETVVGQALEKVRGENQVRQAFGEGMSAVEAFARYQVM